MSRRSRELTGLVLLWLAATAPFLTKAFHIDDTVHVLQARQIVAHPGHPLDLTIFWFEWPERLADSNPVTPPVWQYELAAAAAIGGGPREIVFNGVAALHLLLLTISVYFLAARFLERPLVAAALVVLSPAALVGRNVMLDIPMLSYLVAGIALFEEGCERGRRTVMILGAGLVGIAIVTKLPAIVGVPAVAGYLLLSRRRRDLPAAAVAVIPLGLWYAYQAVATGGIDILRPRGGGGFVPGYSLETSLQVAWNHLVYWGGTVFTGQVFLASLAARRSRAWPVALVPSLVLLGMAVSPIDLGGAAATIMRAAFLIGGAALATGAIVGARLLWHTGGRARRVAGLLILWGVGHVLFDVAGLWEMNVRFALLSAIPATLLCLVAAEGGAGVRARQREKRREEQWEESDSQARIGTSDQEAKSRARMAGMWPAARAPSRTAHLAPVAVLVVGALISFLVAWEDAEWANGYRRVAGEIARAYAGSRIWFVGHWGFQHYATARGLVAYSPRDHQPAAGDLFVVPLVAARQSIPEAVRERLTEIERRDIIPVLPVRTMGAGGGFYSTGWGSLPWGWSRQPAEVVVIARYE